MKQALPAGKVSHFLLTRFNLRCFNDFAAPEHAALEWRFKLFERFTLPSVAAQTEKDFIFLVLFDRHTPGNFLQRIEAAQIVCPNIRWALVDRGNIAAALEPLIPSQTEWLITTRLDNDDAISNDFIARVQNATRPLHRSFVNLCRGMIYDCNARRLYKRTYLYNPFASVIEERKDFAGIYHYAHSQIHEYGPVAYDFGLPAFLQTVHGGNLMNRVQGIPVSGTGSEKSFGLAPGTLANQGCERGLATASLVLEEQIFLLKQFYHLLPGEKHGNLQACFKSLLA